MADTPPPANDMSEWSYACANDQHAMCKAYYTNPDPDCPPDQATLPCMCDVQTKHAARHLKDTSPPPRRGRPPKSAQRDVNENS